MMMMMGNIYARSHDSVVYEGRVIKERIELV